MEQARYRLGYVTGCFDLPHQAHFELLRKIKRMCSILIVGLTTDERCKQEKRKPLLDYAHRYSILQNCKWVDLICENTGCSKHEDWKKYNFDVLFTSDEYMGSKEMTEFEKVCPGVPVMYIPRTRGVSTTQLIDRLRQRFVTTGLSFYRMSLHGPILKFENWLIKPIHVGFSEIGTTSNVYKFPIPNLPRNWKCLQPEKMDLSFPMISGTNANRELYVIPLLQKKPWNPAVSVTKVYTNPFVVQEVSPFGNYGHVQEERRYPKEIFWMYMKNVQPTLHEWILKNENAPNFASTLVQLIERVRKITVELVEMGLVHGDVHTQNLCYTENQLFLIDWGWCMAHTFEMDSKERDYYHSCLRDRFDWNHFLNSLEFMYHRHSWWPEVGGCEINK